MASVDKIITNICMFVICIFSFANSILAQNIHYETHRECTYSFLGTPGIALLDFVFETTYTKTVRKCALTCLSRRECNSFNYQDGTDLCQLNTVSQSCVPPKHIVLNGTMRHFSPPSVKCWKERCVSSHGCGPRPNLPTSVQLESNTVYKGIVTSIKSNLSGGRKWSTNIIPKSLGVESAFAIQLYGGVYPHEGHVEFQYKLKFGGICEDTWDLRDADVICRQLGFEKGASSLASRVGFDNGEERPQLDVVMTDIECSGNEATIDECKYILVKTGKCLHGTDASVICVPDKANPVVFENVRSLNG